ncbi:hypothetical protein T5B8_16999 [Salinisphaera sp. T5B8]|uniref:hypothetical protein n=1 Tax=Salinisphaera sp. T5B8 TaxID=1304154 RepID=UPI003342A0F6
MIEAEVQTDLAEFRDQGMAVYELPESMREALEPKYQAAQQAWVKRMAGRGLDGQAVIDAYESALAEVQAGR